MTAVTALARYHDLQRNRLRRLRRLVESIEELEADAAYVTPPESGVVMGGPLFRAIGREFLEYFVTLGELDTDADVLDVGCGGGRMAVPLTYYLQDGSYVGLDIHAESIAWCKREVEPQHERFRFEHVDLFNDAYNGAADQRADQFRFPHDDDRFDFIVATSLFTHMFRNEVAHYLTEFARVLRPGGVAFVTAFLLNPDSVTAMARETGARRFPYVHDDTLVSDPERPAAAVAMHEEWLRADARRAGLAVDRVAYGSWTNQERLAMQDTLILRHDRVSR